VEEEEEEEEERPRGGAPPPPPRPPAREEDDVDMEMDDDLAPAGACCARLAVPLAWMAVLVPGCARLSGRAKRGRNLGRCVGPYG
jgi:hypothetical protein